mmetsp:Transcript_118365/g.335667  ORF Transcript_118365/g.335667 Transcript_118365/m.335667 type:complete len:225 (-) Transcript_118365:197-871(-)
MYMLAHCEWLEESATGGDAHRHGDHRFRRGRSAAAARLLLARGHSLQRLVDPRNPQTSTFHDQLAIERCSAHVLVDELEQMFHAVSGHKTVLLDLEQRECDPDDATDATLEDQVHRLHDCWQGQPLPEKRQPAVREVAQRLDAAADEVAPQGLEVPLREQGEQVHPKVEEREAVGPKATELQHGLGEVPLGEVLLVREFQHHRCSHIVHTLRVPYVRVVNSVLL